MSLKGTKTAVNLMKSFAGESQARMRYDYYAKEAKKEGYVQISQIFEETALNEMEHAKRFYKFLRDDMEGETIAIDAGFPVNFVEQGTRKNLEAAACGENEEHTELYPGFANIAEEEGFKEIAMVWRQIAKVEAAHEARYRKLAANIDNDQVFKKDEEVQWKCIKCGYISKGKQAPNRCPSCAHPQSYFEVFKETY